MVLYFLRGAFILLAAAVTMLYVLPFQAHQGIAFNKVLMMIGLALGVTSAIIVIDILLTRKKVSSISGVFLGLVAGLLAAFALSFVVDLIGLLAVPRDHANRDVFLKLLEGVKVFIGLITCYVGISLVIQTKDDFRFVIPYVEFTKQIRGHRPTLLDTSVIIDGRILDIVNSRVLQGLLIVPRFVLDELHRVADSSDPLRRARGRRGLEILRQLQDSPHVDVSIEDTTEAEGLNNVDHQLVALAQQMNARIMTTDFNLDKIADLRGVHVINLNQLATAMRPVALPGEGLTIKLIRPGEAANQAVGFLPDGTMVVVEHARSRIGQEVDVTVTSTLQTAAGRMIFTRPSQPNDPGKRPSSSIDGHPG